jgi:hypothetical protein
MTYLISFISQLFFFWDQVVGVVVGVVGNLAKNGEN